MTESEVQQRSPRTSADDEWHRLFNWENLRSVGSSWIATFSMFMPFLGFAILYNSQISELLEQTGISFLWQTGYFASEGSGATAPVGLSMIARLNLLYLGSFIIGAGTILYRLSAPKTVRQHPSIESFFNTELDRASARRLRTMVYTISQRNPAIARQLINSAPWLDREKIKLKIAYAELRELSDTQLQADVLSSYYNVESRYYLRPAMYTVVVLYSLGFLLVSIPGAVFTYRVLISIFNQIDLPFI